MKHIILCLIFLLSINHLSGQQIVLDDKVNSNANNFILAKGNAAANILLDADDYNTALLAARLFAEDVERVTGLKPSRIYSMNSLSGDYVIAGSIEGSKVIQELISRGVIDVSEIEGQWEACLIQVVDNPFDGVNKALVIAGSDRRGTAYGLLELSKQMGVSPWHYFADVPPAKREEIVIKQGRFIQKSPSVKYRGIFINDEMWSLRPWAMNTLAPEEGKGLGPTTYAKIFELLLRLKANYIWPAMHQQTIPFNVYEDNKHVADEYGIVMGASHIEPMLRNSIAGAEWDREYPDQAYDYVVNRDNVYEYWENAAIRNGQFENIYTIGKRGKDDEPGLEVNVEVLGQIFADQREILAKWVNEDVTKVPQVLIKYTEVLNLYNQGLEVPDDVIMCWVNDNFGNIRQLPNEEEQKRPGGSGMYYHFQWINGATSAYPWLYSSPLARTWVEMKKAYDYNIRELWIVNVGDIKPAEVGIEHFMQMAWDISKFETNDPEQFLIDWATREFGSEFAIPITRIMKRHLDLGYVRRPEHMVMYDGRTNELQWEWFSVLNYNDEAQKRIDAYTQLIEEVDEVYESLPLEMKDAFLQMVVYNAKGAALHNKKILYAQKSNLYGKENRASAATYAARAQLAANKIDDLINHYNKEQLTVGAKWDHMASLPGPWGHQWRQWQMPPVSTYSGEGHPKMHLSLEGGESNQLPVLSVYNKDKRYIDIFNTGMGMFHWEAVSSADWIELSETSGTVFEEQRIWVTVDWERAPKGAGVEGMITFRHKSSRDDIWRAFESLSEANRQAYMAGTLSQTGPEDDIVVTLNLFNPAQPSLNNVRGFVESNGYISMEAESYTAKTKGKHGSWDVIRGLGRTAHKGLGETTNSVGIFPTNIPSYNTVAEVLTESPSLEYDIYTFSEGEVQLVLNCIPTYPANPQVGPRFAVSLNNEDPVMIHGTGRRDVISNLLQFNTKLNIPAQGQHTLKIWMTDPTLIIDKIMINTGEMKESYLGPPESVFHDN